MYFLPDTQEMFAKLTSQSNTIKQKFRENGDEKVNGDVFLGDMESLKKSWVTQQEIFNSYGIELEGRQLSTESIKAELTIALGFVGKALLNKNDNNKHNLKIIEKDRIE